MRFCSSIKFFIHVVATRWRIVSAKLLPIAVCALGLAAQDVSAQSADIPFEFEEISVTAERPAPSEPDAVDSQITTAFSTRLTRKDWTSDSKNLGDLLAKTAGIQVRKTGGLGGFAFMSMRGSLSDQVAIYLDGFLLNDAAGGGVNLNSIALGEIESIEIYEGVAPFQGGRAPIGGAVFLRSRAITPQDRATLSLGFGNQKNRSANISASGHLGKNQVGATLDFLAASNNFTYLNNNGTNLNPADDAFEARVNNAYHRYSALIKTDSAMTKDHTLSASYRAYSSVQELPTWTNLKVHTLLENSLQHLQVKLASTTFPVWYQRSALTLDLQEQKERYDDHLGEIGLGQQNEQAATRSTAARWFADRAWGTSLFQTSFDWRFETYNSSDTFHPPSLYYDRLAVGASASATVFEFNDQLIIKPTLIAQGFLGNQGAVANPDVVFRTLRVNPQLGIRYSLTSSLTMKANLSRAQREPAVYELFGDRGYFIGNPDLVPEQSTNADIGFEYKSELAPYSLPIQWTSVIFSQSITNGITKTYSAQGVGKAVNIGKAQIYGIENLLQASHPRFGSLALNTTLLSATNKTKSAMAYQKHLPGRFRETYSAIYKVGGPRLQFQGEYLFQRGLYFDNLNFFSAKDRAVLDVSASLTRRFGEISLSIQNLTNQQYEDFNGYPYADRIALANYKFTF